MSKPHDERTLSVPAEQLRAALDKLDAGSRALLDLSVKRGIADDEIAQVLRAEPAEVAERRESILARIAEDLGSNGPDLVSRVRKGLRELPPEGIAVTAEDNNGHAAEAEPAEEVDGEIVAEAPTVAEEDDTGPVVEGEVLEELPAEREEPSAEVAEPPVEDAPVEPPPVEEPPVEELPIEKEPVTESSAPRGRAIPRAAALAVLAAVAAIVLVVVLVSGGDESSDGGGGQAQQSQQQPPNGTPLAPISGKGRATATIEGRRLTLTATGLGAGGHEAWLYDSLSDSVSIGRLKGGRLTAALSADPAKYRYLDVSVEPRDGNPNHSGESVLRVPISRLTRGG